MNAFKLRLPSFPLKFPHFCPKYIPIDLSISQKAQIATESQKFAPSCYGGTLINSSQFWTLNQYHGHYGLGDVNSRKFNCPHKFQCELKTRSFPFNVSSLCGYKDTSAERNLHSWLNYRRELLHWTWWIILTRDEPDEKLMVIEKYKSMRYSDGKATTISAIVVKDWFISTLDVSQTQD